MKGKANEKFGDVKMQAIDSRRVLSLSSLWIAEPGCTKQKSAAGAEDEKSFWVSVLI